MNANKLMSGAGASLLTTELLSFDSDGDQTADNTDLISTHKKQFTKANEGETIEENCLLLLQNCQMLISIATKIGAKTIKDPVSMSDNLLEVKQHLSFQNRFILIGIAQKLGIMIPTLPKIINSDLVTENHLLLLGNGLILRAIASSLGINIPAGAAQLSGSIIEQNHQLLLANQHTLKAIARKLDAKTAAFENN